MTPLSITTLYGPGDVVKIRDDLVPYESVHDFKDRTYYRMWGWDRGIVANKEMSELRGKYVTITDITNGRYKISEDNGRWAWTDEMFEGIFVPTPMPDPENTYEDFDWS